MVRVTFELIISCFCPAELSLIREFCFLCNLFILFTFNYLKLYNYGINSKKSV